MIRLYDGQLTDILLNDARYDPEVMALSYAVLQEKRRLMDRADGTRTLAMIDALPEHILDLLSVELRTPYYDETHPIETKRDLIRRTFLFYQYMGTPEAVRQMLDAAFPGSFIEEWFDYGGEPFHFKVIVETARFRGKADIAEIRHAVNQTKRESAHLEEVVFQCRIGITIGTRGRGYLYDVPLTGKLNCGTWPHRSTTARLTETALDVGTQAEPFRYQTNLTGKTTTGTKPSRNTTGAVSGAALTARADMEAYSYAAPQAGTVPRRDMAGGFSSGALTAESTGGGYSYAVPQAGTIPRRDTPTRFYHSVLEAETSGNGFRYEPPRAGTVPRRNTAGGFSTGALTAESTGGGYPYAVPQAGTIPRRDTTAGGSAADSGAFEAAAEGKGYHYRVKPCGTKRGL